MQAAKLFGDIENYSIYVLNGQMGLAGAPNGEQRQSILTQAIYDVIYPFVNGYAVVKRDNYYGIIDKYGHETIPATKYAHVSPLFDFGCYGFSDNHGGGTIYLDANNIHKDPFAQYNKILKKVAMKLNVPQDNLTIFPLENPDVFCIGDYDDNTFWYNSTIDKIISYCPGLFVNKDKIIITDTISGKQGIIDIYGNKLVPCVYDKLLFTYEDGDIIDKDLIEASQGGKCGYIDYHGNIRIPFIYHLCGGFINGYAWVCNDNEKCGLIDKSGNIIEPLIHYETRILSNGTIVFCEDDFSKYSVKGKPADYVKQRWEHVYFSFEIFHNPDYVGVQTRNKKRGITHLNGNEMIPAVYDDIAFWQTIHNGGVIVKKDGLYGIISLDNKILVPFEYGHIQAIENVRKNGNFYVYYRVMKFGMFGVLDNNFRECIPIMYNNVTFSKAYSSFLVSVKNEYAMVDLTNNILIPFSRQVINCHD